MLWASVRGEMTTVLLVIIGLIVAGLFSRVMRVLATVCTLGFAASRLCWFGNLGRSEPKRRP